MKATPARLNPQPYFLSLDYNIEHEEKSTEAFLREEVFGSKKQTKPTQQSEISDDKARALKQAELVSNRYKHGVNQSASPLSLRLEFNKQGKLVYKLESSALGFKEYKYDFDLKGHLLNVWCNDKLQEQYYYNEFGQRQKSFTPRLSAEYSYNNLGQLVYSDAVSYVYDTQGRLIAKQYKGKNTTFEYNNPRYHTLLTKVILENGDCIQYLYDEIMPIAKYVNSILTERYIWKNPYQLLKWQDCIHNKEYEFEYADKRSPVAVYTNNQRYGLGCDQVGSVKIVLDYMGNLIKYIDYDSFGNLLADSNKAFFLPLTFAGGLLDNDTGLLHFGYRAYDPKLGRFITPDPLGDTGGDHDLYDYCVDDPISSNDFSGLQGQAVWNENDHPRDDIGQFTDKGETDNEETSETSYPPLPWYKPWWLAPYGHPVKTANLEGIKIGMKERTHKFAAGFLEVDELLLPTLPNLILNPIVLPSYKRTNMRDKWNEDGTQRK